MTRRKAKSERSEHEHPLCLATGQVNIYIVIRTGANIYIVFFQNDIHVKVAYIYIYIFFFFLL